MVDESAREPDRSLLDGTPYRVVKRLGGGGMGEIYEAIEGDGGAPVAVKLLRAGPVGHAELVDRMRR